MGSIVRIGNGISIPVCILSDLVVRVVGKFLGQTVRISDSGDISHCIMLIRGRVAFTVSFADTLIQVIIDVRFSAVIGGIFHNSSKIIIMCILRRPVAAGVVASGH